MRGNKKDLENIKANAKDFRNLFIRMFISNILICILYLRNGYSFITFAKRSILESICVFMAYRAVRPIIIEEKEGVKKIVYSRSINDGGYPAALIDTASFLVVAKCTVLFSLPITIFVLLLIPMSFVIELLYKPYKKVTQDNVLSNDKILKKTNDSNKKMK
ncbi:hypothetical protein EHP00_1236 [Ecytonucleospora hepatopenaei]|uniref:Uncharacterized protein n=1 Tax=Ecytonucleospora hepatopenaei TaxID=646526 RepID=A0A1W0E3G9_9MICR|nr:hypothetical protein EHP00_1236 [Ecytonucleospora hepatopenaei]